MVPDNMDALEWLRKHLEGDGSDLLREMVRSFARGKVYINTGTWMPMVNLRLSNLGQSLALHYGLVEWRDDGPPRASLHRWHGRRADTEEVIS